MEYFSLQMPRKYTRKDGAKPREAIPPEILKAAVDKVLTGNPLHATAKEYGLDRNTLRRYVRKIQEGQFVSFSTCYTASQVFSEHEESEIASYLEIMARMNHGLNTNLVDKLAYDLAVRNNKKYPESWDREKKAGYFWRRGFLDRNPNLSLKKPEPTSMSRSTSFNKHNVAMFFENLRHVIERDKFGPESIWNADETGVTTVQKCPRVIAPKRLKQVGHVTSAERGQTVTICNAISAIGNSIPPFFIFPRVKLNPAFLFGAPPGSNAAPHVSGWMTEETFLLFLQHFVKYTKCSKEKKVLLILDNHESHISLAAIDFARSNGIVMLTFPPHCSHRLQPLDVCVYAPFKTYYNVHCSNKLTIENPGVPLTIYNVAEIVGKAFPQAFTPANIMKGFKTTGIWPFNDAIFTDADFIGAYVTDRPVEEEHETNRIHDTSRPSTSLDTGSLDFVGANPSVFTVSSPENILPYPKAGKRKKAVAGKGHKKGKTMLATDSPNRKEIEERKRQKEEKKKYVNQRKVKKALFRKNIKVEKNKRKQQKPQESETSESECEMPQSPQSSEDDSIEEEHNQKVKVDDWVIVKFYGKKRMRYFVGLVTDNNHNVLTVKFARRLEGNRFKWPDVTDVSEVDLVQIDTCISPPDFTVQNDRVTSFEFNYSFSADVE